MNVSCEFRYSWTKRLSGICLSLAMLTLSSNASSQPEIDEEWPCIQRLVMEVSPAIMWPVPIDESMENGWRDDREVRRLAEELGGRKEEVTDDVLARIGEFAESIAVEDRERRLSALATGIVEVTNRQRKKFISGIKRYTRQQIDISGQINDTLNQLSMIESGELDKDQSDQQEIEETLRWHERVYDQRERVIISLCEEPVELEQNLSAILREMAQYLP
ncbi:MAG: hypothetical protein AB8B63_14915 [Granulosicoccus sp.]